MTARWGDRAGGTSSRKHGIGGHVSPNSRHVREAARLLERDRRRRPKMYDSIRELFARGR